ncbi:MAG: glycosyltransferase family 2 protein [Flavobacteriales bacterium]|nr:glycosyltransferase family 2 protein [Flavobacteriales bacterium]
MNEHATSSPVVSVIITLYNKAEFVEEALKSVLGSTFTDFEVLVIDDGSTDDGPERLAGLGDSRVRLFRSASNTGRAAAANRGFAAARGEYMAILDADDLMEPERLELQVAFMQAHHEVVACGTAAQIIGRGGHIARWPESDRECRARLIFEDPLLYGSAMFRRSVMERHGVRCDEQWRVPGMDYLVQVSLSRFGRFANLQEPLTRYRIHDGNVRHGRDPVADKLLIQSKVFDMLGIAATAREVENHIMLHRLFVRPPNAGAVRDLRRWLDKLVRWNRSIGFADDLAFRRIARGYWDHLFYVLPDTDRAAALLHVFSWWPIRLPHLLYLIKHALRSPNRKRASA